MLNIIEITDFNAPELDVYARLTEAQLLNRHNLREGLFIAESPKVIWRALDAGYDPVSFLVEPKHIHGEAKEVLERCAGLPVYTAPLDVLTQLTGFQLTRRFRRRCRHRGVISNFPIPLQVIPVGVCFFPTVAVGSFYLMRQSKMIKKI